MKPFVVEIDDYHEVVKNFHNESDRSAAVLAASYVDNYLVKYLRSFMVHDPKVEEWFDGFGPFATYKQRVVCGYAFGLLSEIQKTDLDFIGKIRNHFAHYPLEASFDKQPICNWVQQLSSNNLSKNEGIEHTNKDKYIFAISFCVANMYNNILERNKSALTKGLN